MIDLAGRTTGSTVSIVVILAIGLLALVILSIAALWRIFADADEAGWKAVVPVYNIWVLLRITGKPAWWLVLFFVPVANIVVSVYVYRTLASSYGRGGWFTAGLVCLGVVFLPLLAFGGTGRVDGGRSRDDLPQPALWAPLLALALVVGMVIAYAEVSDDSAPAGGLTAREQQAVTAASVIAANLSTYSRADFAHDFNRVLEQTTGQLHTQVAQLRKTTQQTLTSGKFDLTAQVRHAALIGPADPGSKDSTNAYLVLVNLYGYQSIAPTNPLPQNLQVTVEQVKGTWLASDVSSVGIQ